MNYLGLASLVLLPLVIGFGLLYMARMQKLTNRKFSIVLSVGGWLCVAAGVLIGFIIAMTITGMKAEGVL